MTGHSQPAENTPYFGSVVAKLCPPSGNVPPYVWLQNLAGDVQPRYLTGGFLGAAYAPLRVGTDLDNSVRAGLQGDRLRHRRPTCRHAAFSTGSRSSHASKGRASRRPASSLAT